jgi:DNA-binding XRE family transcriptional regulator
MKARKDGARMEDTTASIPQETIGHNVMLWREYRRLSRQELADLVEVNQKTIWNLEKGLQATAATTVAAVAKALNAPLDQIFGPRLPEVVEETPRSPAGEDQEALARAAVSAISGTIIHILEDVGATLIRIAATKREQQATAFAGAQDRHHPPHRPTGTGGGLGTGGGPNPLDL